MLRQAPDRGCGGSRRRPFNRRPPDRQSGRLRHAPRHPWLPPPTGASRWRSSPCARHLPIVTSGRVTTAVFPCLMLPMRSLPALLTQLREPGLERAVGVISRPETELQVATSRQSSRTSSTNTSGSMRPRPYIPSLPKSSRDNPIGIHSASKPASPTLAATGAGIARRHGECERPEAVPKGGVDHTYSQGEMVNVPSTVFQESLVPCPVPVKINVKLLPPSRYHLGAKFHWNRVFGRICVAPNRSR